MHTFLSSHTTAAPAQMPAAQASLDVQKLPSVHKVPLVNDVWAQAPPVHASVVQGLLSTQGFVLPPVHRPV